VSRGSSNCADIGGFQQFFPCETSGHRLDDGTDSPRLHHSAINRHKECSKAGRENACRRENGDEGIC
jgi:hypothetical protein